MMKFSLFAVMAALACSFSMIAAETSGAGPVYEMRVYYAPEGKLDELHARFRNHTLKLFEKHGMKNLGYFVPEGANPQRKLVYFLEHASREQAKKSWQGFGGDPDWQKAWKESEKNGKLVEKIDSVYLETTDYSPKLSVAKKGNRVFELRTYRTPEGKLKDLNARFRNHTVALFKKHGMDNLIYWTPVADQKNASTTLIYLLAHQSREAARASFEAFRKDPDWLKAKGESEKNGSLTLAEGGVVSEFLVPTDYSPLK